MTKTRGPQPLGGFGDRKSGSAKKAAGIAGIAVATISMALRNLIPGADTIIIRITRGGSSSQAPREKVKIVVVRIKAAGIK